MRAHIPVPCYVCEQLLLLLLLQIGPRLMYFAWAGGVRAVLTAPSSARLFREIKEQAECERESEREACRLINYAVFVGLNGGGGGGGNWFVPEAAQSEKRESSGMSSCRSFQFSAILRLVIRASAIDFLEGIWENFWNFQRDCFGVTQRVSAVRNRITLLLNLKLWGFL
jgi:hypothetical protein